MQRGHIHRSLTCKTSKNTTLISSSWTKLQIFCKYFYKQCRGN